MDAHLEAEPMMLCCVFRYRGPLELATVTNVVSMKVAIVANAIAYS